MLAVTALVALVVIARIEQNRELKDTLAGLAQQQGSSGSSGTSAYEAGMQIPDVELRSLDGSERRSADILSSKVGVLAVMTTTCQFCQLTIPQWGSIAEELNQRGAALAAVSLDNLDRYACLRRTKQHQLRRRGPHLSRFSVSRVVSRVKRIS
jgi:hypothetical protein